MFLSLTIYYIKQVIKGLFCFPGVFHYTEVVEDAEGSAFFDQVSNISTGIFVRGSPYILQVLEFVSFLTEFIMVLILNWFVRIHTLILMMNRNTSVNESCTFVPLAHFELEV